ncbi:MAG: Asp-tRNA(Asn)/Glu-tRNA(Gln) amidotransferase subunit GatA [Candidatus Binatia bacterium]|nr:Asp-tRNA(Asn)/Glu-tRNA(Gln) amidotransferase subunit GatA [Candidatus Binatia bacterium]
MSDLVWLSLAEVLRLLDAREISSVELTKSILAHIDAVEPKIRAFLTVTPEAALAGAEEADRRRATGERGGLLGVPIAVKDVILTKGVRTTAGSRILENFVPPYDATVITRLRQAGVVFLGKLNCDEFAMGSSTENSAFGPTYNPWSTDRVPGGSSGGSAAAVAAGQCYAALGTDTGGSIRQPAACCGIVGVKPSYGRVSRYGLIAYASSFDQIGPMARTVEDCALLLEVIAGRDERDATSTAHPVPRYSRSLACSLREIRLAVPRECFGDGVQPEVRDAVESAIRWYQEQGATVTETSLPHTRYAVPTYYLVATAEASSNLARYDGVRFGFRAGEEGGLLSMYSRTRALGFGAEVKRRIMLGTYALSAGYYDAYYLKALKVRTLVRRDFEAAFEKAHIVILPTAPTTAFRLGEKTGDPLQMYLSDIFTIAANLAGLPALSLPCGFDRQDLPIGLQLIARPFCEAQLLAVAHAYERAHPWVARHPSL